MGITPSEFLIRELRRRRVAAGLTQTALGELCFCSDTHISSIETGGKAPTLKHLELVDVALETGGYFENLWDELVKDWVDPSWLRDWIEYERQALYLRWYEPAFVPGLLQTEEYARATLRTNRLLSPEEVELRVASRMDRQSILARKEPPDLYVILDAAVLRRTVAGDADLMARQLDHLIERADQPHIQVQVVPEEVGIYPGLAGAFILAGMPDGSTVAHVDNQVGADVFERADYVASLVKAWENIGGETLPRRQSLELLKEAAQKWK